MSILIIDLGGQYCHMISRTLGDLGIPSDIRDPSVTFDEMRGYDGIILSGGPQSVYEAGSPTIHRQIVDLGIVPILGLCYGHQLLARMLGGTVTKSDPEYGSTAITMIAVDPILEGTPDEQIVWMSHGDSVISMPERVIVSSSSKDCPVVSFHHMDKPFYGLQFHPEVAHTENGRQMLQNFADICGIKPIPMADRIASIIEQIKQTVGDKNVLFFVSGGVDSTVAFVLCAKALNPDQLRAIYVDTGFMRKTEAHDIQDCFDRLGLSDRLIFCDESNRFMSALNGVIDPEDKRKIIGRLFVNAQSRATKNVGVTADWMLGQGTIYPDVIESGKGSAATIKTHHNRCPEIQELIQKGQVIEPLREFYKDQVREIGHSLGIPAHFVERWPFPGPGLAIRCLCTNNSDAIVPIEQCDQYDGVSGLYELGRVPLRSVGVQGDARTYRTTLAVKGPLNKCDLTVLARLFPEDRVIAHIAGTIDLRGGRVVPATITPARIAILRSADHIVRSAMIGHEHLVWQFPVVLIPLSFGRGETIVLRPVASRDGMTANFVIPPNSVLDRISNAIMAMRVIDAVFLDVSDKPPATIEWE